MSIVLTRRSTKQKIRELTRLTGESQADAVDKAVRERLDRIRDANQNSMDLLIELQAQAARATTNMDDMYDEDGLPR